MILDYRQKLVTALDRKLNKRWPTISDNVMDDEHEVSWKELAFKSDTEMMPLIDDVVEVIVHAMENSKCRRMIRMRPDPSKDLIRYREQIIHGRRCSLRFTEIHSHLGVSKRIDFFLEVPKS